MITKRMVGLALILLGLLIAGGTLVVDLIDAGKWGGFGPAQRLAFSVGLGAIAIGLSLIPLGHRPA